MSSVTVSLCSYLTRLLTVRADLVTSLCQGAAPAPAAPSLRCATHRPRQSSFLRLCPHLTEPRPSASPPPSYSYISSCQKKVKQSDKSGQGHWTWTHFGSEQSALKEEAVSAGMVSTPYM